MEFVDITREDIVIRQIFEEKPVQDKITPHLDHKLFDDKSNQHIMKLVGGYHKKYKKFPSVLELVSVLPIDSPERLKLKKIATFDYKKIHDEFKKDLTQRFFQEQKTKKILLNAAEALSEKNFSNLPSMIKELQEAVNFSLHLDVGLHLVNSADEALRRLTAAKRTIPSSIPQLMVKTSDDGKTGGGYYRKALSLYQGMPNMGKTIFLCNEAAFAYQCGYNVLYITLEMAEEAIWERIAMNITDFPKAELKNQSVEDVKRLLRENKQSCTDKCGELYVKSMKTTANPSDIEALMSEIYRDAGIKFDLLVVDYLGIIKPAKRAGVNADNLHVIGKEVAEQLRDIAVTYDLALLSANQFGKEGYDDLRPSMKHTAGSSAINNTADLIISISQDDNFRKYCLYLLGIIKNRFGAKEVVMIVHCDYTRMRIREPKSEKMNEYRSNITTQQEVIEGFNTESSKHVVYKGKQSEPVVIIDEKMIDNTPVNIAIEDLNIFDDEPLDIKNNIDEKTNILSDEVEASPTKRSFRRTRAADNN